MPVAHPFDPLPRKPPTAAEPVTVNKRTLPADVFVPRHDHPWAQLAWATAGAMRIAADGATWIAPPSRAVWIPPRIEHEVVAIGAVELRTVYVAPGAAPLPLDACLVLEVSPLLGALIEELAAGPSVPVDANRRELLTRLALDEMGRAARLSFRLPLPTDRRLRALCDALLAAPADERRLEDWAGQTGASPRTLARLFRAELGMSFGQWRQQMRLAQAAALVAKGKPLAAVADALGYASPSAFSAMFKRAFGMPPSRFFNARA